MPLVEVGTQKRHCSDYYKSFSKWSNNSGNLDITLYRVIWNIFPLNFRRFTFLLIWPKISVFWEKISFKWGGVIFYERYSFRFKWFRTYLRPFLVQKQQVLGHMKYSPIDHQSILLEIYKKMSYFWEKISFKWGGVIFYERYSFRCKWFRTYLRPFLGQKQQVLGHMKYSPIDLQPIQWQFCLKTVILVSFFALVGLHRARYTKKTFIRDL